MDGPAPPDVPPEGHRDPRVFSPQPITTDHPPILGWAAAAVVVVLLLVLKPWDPGGGGGSATTAGVSGPTEAATADGAVAGSATPVPSPSRTDTAGPEVADFCLDPGIWLVATVEGYGDRARRIWRALPTASVADGPTDASIPETTIVTEGIRLLGWCAPVVGPDRPSSAARIDIWRIDGGTADPAQLTAIRPADGPSPFGAIYAPPSGADGLPRVIDPAWPDGRLVFRYAAGPMVRWFAIDVSSRALPSTVP